MRGRGFEDVQADRRRGYFLRIGHVEMRRGGGLGLRRGSRGCGNSEPVYEAAASHHLKISPITAARHPLHTALVSRIQFSKRNTQIQIHKYKYSNTKVQEYDRQLSPGNVPHYNKYEPDESLGGSFLVSSIHSKCAFSFLTSLGN